ncbi:MAG: TIGR03617 family F420-dependent LLM class oxidoreductase [Chloroflexi bacterium]|nr:TIGR03617 family F420-dependent LLM class oxidoreductase [Chloroflexota bacterium]MCY3583617.1 TIGR03617 family F420-dependent LLM class oxidoreductase [Chloroflexota bacterium]MCY3715739.1 TIGR03617 family F420-dependent LLM class oxidoreductase [Chloroflexota bacterium]MDE2651258.1 TIGR03617 family F420-dependent LLM class oxidoreductase [Chloroflexota bacterium]MXV94106.1 TIGR03617 family F420-dependent LLM class oxidoreductase [Chloroflexota bacterium]
MKFDISFFPSGDLRADADLIASAEAAGFSAAWGGETARNPFLPLTIAASASESILLGTQSAVAFPRSPMVTAQIAWDLARQSNGRFVLGLGAQERAHIEQRFSETWTDPVGRMREYIESLRAIWATFQHDARLRYRGQHYQFRLMSPFFNPGPNAEPDIPIFLAGANPGLCRLAGETCAGLHAPALHTVNSLREQVLPAIKAGLAAVGRARADFALAVPVWVVSGDDAQAIQRAEAEARSRIAFYASAPGAKRVMTMQGWGGIAEELVALARMGQWGEMAERIPEQMLREVAIVAAPEEALPRIKERYAGLADRICLAWGGLDDSVRVAVANGLSQV